MNLRSFLLAVSGLLFCAAAQAQPVVDLKSADGRLTHVAWKPSGRVERWIVSLHGFSLNPRNAERMLNLFK